MNRIVVLRNKSLAITFCLLLVFSCALRLTAQYQIAGFERLTAAEGLASNQYNSFLYKDSRGFVWIGSYFGLSRFDGLEVITYQAGTGEGQLPEDAIQSSFFEDKQGDIWFTTLTFLVRYDRGHNNFESIKLILPSGEKAGDGYHIIGLDKQSGVIWLNANDFLWAYQISEGTYRQLGSSLGIRFGTLSDQSGHLHKLIACPWMREYGIEIFQLPENTQSADFEKRIDLLDSVQVNGAHIQNDSVAWLASGKGLGKYDLSSGELINWLSPKGQTNFAIWSLVKLDEKYLLISALEKGLWLFDLENQLFSGPLNIPETGNTPIEPKDIYLDEEGFLWVHANNQGVVYFRLLQSAENELLLPGMADNLSVVSIWALPSDSNVLIVSTAYGGIYRYSRQFKDGIFYWVPEFVAAPQPYSELLRSFVDQRAWWWAVYRNGMSYSKDQGQTWEMLEDGGDVQYLYATETPGGRLLAGTSRGVLEIKWSAGRVLATPCPEFVDYPGLQLTHFYCGTAANCFMAYKGREVWICKENPDHLELTQRVDIQAQLFGVWEKPGTGEVWLATSIGLVVLRYSEQQKIFEVLKPDPQFDRLTGLAIYSILEDRKGNLWFTTNKGLWKKENESQQLLRFWKEDGLISEQYNFFAGHVSREDMLIWLGTVGGLHVFNSESLKPYEFSSKPVILELMLPDGPFVSDTVIDELDFIKLSHNQNTLTFEMRAVSNYLSKENKINYRLVGYDEDWVSIDNGGVARFTKVPPGAYTVEYYALSGNGVKSDTRSLNIHIKPPFYQTLVFKILVLFILFGSTYLIVRSVVRKKIREKERIIERQAALQGERNRIAGELHDDLGSGLSVIRFLSDEIGLEEADPEKQDQMSKIANLSSGLVERMRDIIWALNTDNDKLENLLHFLRRYAVSYLADNKLTCQFNFPDEIPDLEINGERRRNVLLMFKEILHNVVKHADASQVKINMEINAHLLMIEISDNGKGMPEGPVRPGANGLKNLRNRTHSNGGKVKWTTNEWRGTTVQIQEPVKK
ncbi:MAG: hypothetical protein KDC34_14710 [Saprospiraceae bacterium]|nr:hypothetical protein [Saprospiraceae bacterium]